MNHPFFDSPEYPWIRSDALNFYNMLCRTIRDDRDIRFLYTKTGASRALTPMLASDKLWREILDNLSSSGLLDKLCDDIKEGHYNRNLINAANQIIEAKTEDSDLPLPTPNTGIWNLKRIVRPTQTTIKDFRGKWFNFVLSSAIFSGLMLASLKLLFHLTILNDPNVDDSSLLWFLGNFMLGAFFIGIVAAAMSGAKLWVLVKIFATGVEDGVMPFDKGWVITLLVLAVGILTTIIIISLSVGPAPFIYKILSLFLSLGLISGVYLAGLVKKKFIFRSILLGAIFPALSFFVVQSTLNSKPNEINGFRYSEAPYFFSLAVKSVADGLAKLDSSLDPSAMHYAHTLVLVDTMTTGVVFFAALNIANLRVSEPEHNYLFD